MYLRSKIIYNVLLLPVLINSCFKNFIITLCYNPMGQTIAVRAESVAE